MEWEPFQPWQRVNICLHCHIKILHVQLTIDHILDVKDHPFWDIFGASSTDGGSPLDGCSDHWTMGRTSETRSLWSVCISSGQESDNSQSTTTIRKLEIFFQEGVKVKAEIFTSRSPTQHRYRIETPPSTKGNPWIIRGDWRSWILHEPHSENLKGTVESWQEKYPMIHYSGMWCDSRH